MSAESGHPSFPFSNAMIRLSEWRPKCVLSFPSVSIIAFSNAKVRHKKTEWKQIPLGVKFLGVSRKVMTVFATRRKVFEKIRKVFESFSGVL